MKKYSAAIFFPFLFLLAFINAGSLSLGKTGTLSSTTASLNTSLDTDLNYPDPEIEYTGIRTTTVLHGHQVLQKIPGYLAGNTTAPEISSSFSVSAVTPAVELFDNNYLSYNYPSHNFW